MAEYEGRAGCTEFVAFGDTVSAHRAGEYCGAFDPDRSGTACPALAIISAPSVYARGCVADVIASS